MSSKKNNDEDARLPLRKKVIIEGRGMVRVRRLEDRAHLTAAVCPGCWNEPTRRRVLLRRMERLGVEPAHRDDLIGGVYVEGEKHAPECRHNPDRHWERFAKTLREVKGK